MNKRKSDDEFAMIGLSYVGASGEEVVVYCPESEHAPATLHPTRRRIGEELRPRKLPVGAPANLDDRAATPAVLSAVDVALPGTEPMAPELKEQHFSILYGDTGHTYDSIIGPYLRGATEVTIEDPYIRAQHQIQNFLRLCETVVKAGTVKRIKLVTGYDDKKQRADAQEKLEEVKQSLLELDVVLDVQLNPNLHDREIRLDNGWSIKIGRGLDFYQKPGSRFEIGAQDLSLRKCLEAKVDIFRNYSPTPTAA
jgi:ATP-dependent Lon protease